MASPAPTSPAPQPEAAAGTAAPTHGAAGRVAARRRVLALKPLSAPGNEFSGRFSEHIDHAAFETTGFDWGALGRGRYDIVVFHWPTEFFRPTSRKATALLLARMLADKVRHGTRFVWVAHNLSPHDGGSLASPTTTRLFLHLLSGVIYLSRQSRIEAQRLYPALARTPALVTVHGRYGDVAQPARRHDAETPANRLLFFGQIRAYKNVVRLVEEARRVTATPFSLTIAGTSPDPALTRAVVAAAAEDPRIRLDIRDDFIADAELEAIVDAHDAVVLPYRNVLNSGVALHALGRNKPILAPRVGSLPELQDTVGADWVHLFDGEIEASAIDAFFADLGGRALTAPDLSPFEWSRVGNDVSRFLGEL